MVVVVVVVVVVVEVGVVVVVVVVVRCSRRSCTNHGEKEATHKDDPWG